MDTTTEDMTTTQLVHLTRWAEIRGVRNARLKTADTLLAMAQDNGLDEKPFRQYRQALRDIPQTYTNPDDVVWPQKPSLPLASS